MSIEEKLSTVAENTPKVYNQGYEDGKNSVVDLGKYCYSITLADLNDFGTEKLTLNLNSVKTLTALLMASRATSPNTTVKHITVNCPNPLNDFLRVFEGTDNTIERITLNVDLSQANSVSWVVWNYTNLKIVDGTPLNLSALIANQHIFFGCSQLQEVRVVKETLKVSTNFVHNLSFSPETVQSIIDGLADLTGGTAQTLTLHATVGAKLTDEQKATITAKNWTLVY